MGVLVEGKWQDQDAVPTGADGSFVRATSSFRDRVSADGSTPFAPAAGRYHLFVAHRCPWAHRAILYRKLKGLEDVISMSASEMSREGWAFTGGVEGARSVRRLIHRSPFSAGP